MLYSAREIMETEGLALPAPAVDDLETGQKYNSDSGYRRARAG